MTGSPREIPPLKLVGEEADPIDVDQELQALHGQVTDSEARIAGLEDESLRVAEQVAEAERQLETRRTRRGALDRQLREERAEEARLKLEEATAVRQAMLTDAEGKAAQIAERAGEEAEDLVAEARRESDSIIEVGRQRLRVLEEEAVQRAAEIDSEHRATTMELEVMKTVYEELQSTLKLVAETSFKELVEAKSSLAELDQDRPLPKPQRRRVADVRPTAEARPENI